MARTCFARRFVPLLFIVVPLLALPLHGDAIFDEESGHALFADVLRAASFGLTDIERAAFIVRGDDGSLQCEIWPATDRMNAEAFRGTIPPRTLAIVHTHPIDWPLPSAHDSAEAVRLGIPIYVLTERDVYKVTPQSERPDAVVHGRLWFKNVSRSGARCAVLR